MATAGHRTAKDVSCRFFETLLRDLRERGLDPARLVAGTDITIPVLSDKDERIAWETFLALMRNARELWTDEELRQLGERSTESPLVRFIGVVARIRFSVAQFYQWVAGPRGMASQMFSCLDTSCTVDGPSQVTIELRMKPGLSPSRELWLVSEGTYAAMPTMLGAPAARTSATYGPTWVRYRVQFTEARGALARVRRAVSWPFTMRQAADELADAHASLLDRYQELDDARTLLAAQARQLDAANRVAAVGFTTGPADEVVRRVCAVLQDHAGCADVEFTSDEVPSVAVGVRPPSGPRHRFAVTSGDLALGTLDVSLRSEDDASIAMLTSLVPTIALVLQQARDRQALAAYQQQLEQRVADRTAELVHARDDLAATVTRLEEARASRERLFHNISHEIRTPLTLVLLLVDGVLTHHRSELTERAVGQLNAITVSTRKLVRLVDELLLLASGQERNLEVRPEPVELAHLLPELLAGWVLAARDAGLTLDLDTRGAGAVAVDPAAFERVLANLLSNAIKFTPRGGHVGLTVTRGATHTELAVTDDGPGIAPEFRPRLFERFEQGPAGKALRSGSGIGLSIARELVRAHGGDLVADDNPAGRGTRFAFTIPNTDATALATAAPGRLRPTDYGVGSVAVAATTHPPGLSRGHILIAEDDVALAQTIGQLLAEDHTITIAHDGQQALAAATQIHPDLLITDIEMPGIDGLELARQVQAIPGEAATPILVMSARAQLGDRLAGFEAGAVDYLVKPFDPAELRARVRAQLAYRGLAQRLYRTQKLAAMGSLSAGLAHELRNPANGIVNAIAPLRELLPPEVLAGDTGIGELIDVIEQCAEQVAYVSKQLLGFRRSGDLELRQTPVSEVVARALSNAGAGMSGVTLQTELTYTGAIRCAAPLLTQVLVNLLENAAHAAGPGGWVRLATVADDDGVRIELSDSGPGVPPALREKIFEPFFTTKPPGQGTGLGLATARDLITRHGGTLELRIRDGRSIFVVALPRPSEVRR